MQCKRIGVQDIIPDVLSKVSEQLHKREVWELGAFVSAKREIVEAYSPTCSSNYQVTIVDYNKSLLWGENS